MVKLNENIQLAPNSHYIDFIGPVQNGYGIVRKTVAGNRYQIYAHRLVKMNQLGLDEIPETCSHLCHNTFCVNVQHITIEDQGINNNRQKCHNDGNGKFFGHKDATSGANLPCCIFC